MSAPLLFAGRFMDEASEVLLRKVATMIEQLRPLEGERVTDVVESLADLVATDASEADRRLRTELVRTVAMGQAPPLLERVDPEELRLALFRKAWEMGQATGIAGDGLFAVSRESILAAIAPEHGLTLDEVPEAMFADTPGERRIAFPVVGEEELARTAIRMVNLERLRQDLRRAVRVLLRIPGRSRGGVSYVSLLWGLKRLGLMYELAGSGDAILMDISGPYALFGRTTMYGNRLFDAVYLVLERGGSDWTMQVDLLVRDRAGRERVDALRLDASVRSRFVGGGAESGPTERSGDEEAFRKYFGKCATGWTLEHEGALIPLVSAGRTGVMVPDFVLRSPDASREVLVEIVGFWRPEYLRKKIEKVRQIGREELVLIVNSKLSVSREDFGEGEAGNVRVYFYSGREELKRVARSVAALLSGEAGGLSQTSYSL